MEPQDTPQEDTSGNPTWEQLEKVRADENLAQQAPVVISKHLQGPKALERAVDMVKGPPQRHIDLLRSNPDDPQVRKLFEDAYGVGSAEAVMPTMGDVVLDTLKAPIVGFAKGFDEVAQSTESLVEGTYEFLGIKPEFMDTLEWFNAQDTVGDASTDLVGETEFIPGQMVEGISQFAGGFVLGSPVDKVIKTFKGARWVAASVKGMLSDAFAFDPDDPMLVDLAVELGLDPEVIPEFVRDPENSDAEKRLYRALEGAGVGIAADAILSIVKYGAKAAFGKPKSKAEEDAVKRLAKEAIEDANAKAAEIKANGSNTTITLEEETSVSTVREVVTEETVEVTDAADQRLVVTPEELDSTLTTKADELRNQDVSDVPDYLMSAREAANEEAAVLMETRGRSKGMSDKLFMSSMRETFDALDNDATYVSFGSTREELLPKAREFATQIIDKMNSGENVQNLVDMITDQVSAKDLGALNFAAKVATDAVDLHRTSIKKAMDEAISANNVDTVKALEVEYDANLARWLELTQFDAEIGSLSGAILKSRQFKPSAFKEKLANKLNLTDAPLEKTVEKSRKKVTKQTFTLDKIIKLRKLGINIRDAESIVDEALSGADGQQLSKQVKNHQKADAIRNIFDGINEYRTSAGLLSGPKTFQINSLTAGLMTAFNPIIEAIGGGGVKHATRQYTGMSLNSVRAMKEAWHAFKTGETRLTGSGSRLEDNSGAVIPLYLGGPIWRSFGRALMATDTAFKELNYGAGVNLEAAQAADVLGLKGKQRTAFLRDYLNNSFEADGFGKDPRARQLAEIRTFTKDFETNSDYGVENLLRGGQTILNMHPAMRVVVTPFYRTPMRLIEQGMRLSPGLNMIGKRYRRDLMGHNGTLAKYRARGEMAVGTAYVTTAMMLADQGLLTGAYDHADKEYYKNTNIPAESIKIGDKWYSYSQWEPFATPLRMIATVVERRNKLMIGGYDRYISYEEQINNVTASATMALVANFTGSPMMEGFDKWFTMFNEVANGGKNIGDEFSKLMARDAATFIPNIVKKGLMADQDYEQGQSSPDGSVFTDTFFKGLEDVLDLVPNDETRTYLGKRIERTTEADWVITATREANENPVLKEIFKAERVAGVNFMFPSEKKDGLDLTKIRAVTPRTNRDTVDGEDNLGIEPLEGNAGVRSVYDRWKELSGTINFNGMNLEQRLAFEMKKQQYKDSGYGADGDPGYRATVIKQVLNAYREAAWAELQKEQEALQRSLPTDVLLKGRALRLSPNLVDEQQLPDLLRN